MLLVLVSGFDFWGAQTRKILKEIVSEHPPQRKAGMQTYLAVFDYIKKLCPPEID